MALTFGTLVAGCGQAPTTAPGLAGPAAEEAFLSAAASQLCDAQSGVYEDPAALAAAYAAAPEVPGLSQTQVDDFVDRLHSDADITMKLRQAVKESCG
jgi:hypothetical protein